MLKKSRIVLIVAAAIMMSSGAMLGPARAQKDTPKQEAKKLALGEDEVKELLLLMDTDKNGKISRKEYMDFMTAEFDRLDVNKDGELDVKELEQSNFRVSHVGPERGR